MAKIAVIIISDQTVQNVQFIKEFESMDAYWFITTPAMKRKGCGDWIKQTLSLEDEKVQEMEVNEFSPADTQQKITELYTETDTFLVNITGGTKLMCIAVNDFFKPKPNAILYYLTGKNEILNLTENKKSDLKKKILLNEYLISYGISIQKNVTPHYPKEVSAKIYAEFIKSDKKNTDCLKELRDFFQEQNRNARKVTYAELPCLQTLISNFKFTIKEKEELSKDEALYLTGKWLEEYTYHQVKDKLKLDEQSVGLGLLLQKTGIRDTNNDFDVMFIYQNELYMIECKTSHLINGKSQLTEYIYKLDALRKELGIFSKAFIYTLGELPKDDKPQQQNQLKDRLKFHNIKLLTKEKQSIENTQSFEEWLESMSENT